MTLPPLADLVARLGLSAGARGLRPCPVCNADHRGGSDRRPPVALYRGTDGAERWRCHAGGCDSGGDALSLLVAVRHGVSTLPAGDARWAALIAELGTGTADPRSAPAPEPPRWPPQREVLAFLDACAPLDRAPWSDPAIPYLEKHRALDARLLAAMDMARLIPAACSWPTWIPWMGLDVAEWTRIYRLAVPMVDATGAVRGVRFRAVDRVQEPTEDGRALRWRVLDVDAAKKAVAPRGYSTAGLVLADPLGRALLAGERSDEGATWNGQVVVTEGEPDAWTWATAFRRDRWGRERKAGTFTGATWAVLGVVAGSWTPEIAARIPSDAVVTIRTHADEAGDRYAARIAATLVDRCHVKRQAVAA